MSPARLQPNQLSARVNADITARPGRPAPDSCSDASISDRAERDERISDAASHLGQYVLIAIDGTWRQAGEIFRRLEDDNRFRKYHRLVHLRTSTEQGAALTSCWVRGSDGAADASVPRRVLSRDATSVGAFAPSSTAVRSAGTGKGSTVLCYAASAERATRRR